MALWRTIRGWFARVGSDPYYASYERSLGNIKTELDRLQAARIVRAKAWAAIRARFWRGFAAAYAVILAWAAYVNRQPLGTYTHAQQAARVAPAFLAPLAAWLAHRLLGWLQRLLDRRGAARARQLEAKLRKQVTELKDSTRYDRTLALLQKYDPDYAPPKPQRVASARGPAASQQQGAAAATAGGLPARAAGAAVNVAGSALQGAGSRLFPLLGQLYSQAAGTLIADGPVMLGLLRDAQQQSNILRHRLMDAEARAIALLQANIALKQQLGLPTEEEQAALAAWTGSGGKAAGAGDLPAAGEGAAGEGAALAEAEPHAAETGPSEGEAEADEGQGTATAEGGSADAFPQEGVTPGGRVTGVTRRKRGGRS
ncbi:hypothetical protein ABPG75_011253 [Micractinium tetrahymenae]